MFTEDNAKALVKKCKRMDDDVDSVGLTRDLNDHIEGFVEAVDYALQDQGYSMSETQEKALTAVITKALIDFGGGVKKK